MKFKRLACYTTSSPDRPGGSILIFRPSKAGMPIALAGRGPLSLQPRPELCPREESNLYSRVRSAEFCPLNYEGGLQIL